MKEIPLNGIRQKILLCRTSGLKGNFNIMMRPITEEEEKHIDDYKSIEFVDGRVNGGHIISYGEIDIDKEEDKAIIEKWGFVGDDWTSMIPSNYDYDKGVGYTNERVMKYAPTINAYKWFKYCYLLIGKPKRILVYKSSYVRR